MADLALVGIRRGGVPLAARLAALLHEIEGVRPPVGAIDITLYRDDAATALPNPRIGPSHIPFPVDGRRIVLVDDVLYTGRTIRAALDALLDYGRPRRIELAVLVDRGGRELPIQPDYVVRTVEVDRARRVEVVEQDGELGAVVVRVELGQPPADGGRAVTARTAFTQRHLLGIEGLEAPAITSPASTRRSRSSTSRAGASARCRPCAARRSSTSSTRRRRARARRSSSRASGSRADVINISASTSSAMKGETLLDTVKNLEAMRPDVIVIRHHASGAPHFVAERAARGRRQRRRRHARAPDPGAPRRLHHPPREGPARGPRRSPSAATSLHSRVARSNAHLLRAMGARVRFAAPADAAARRAPRRSARRSSTASSPRSRAPTS